MRAQSAEGNAAAKRPGKRTVCTAAPVPPQPLKELLWRKRLPHPQQDWDSHEPPLLFRKRCLGYPGGKATSFYCTHSPETPLTPTKSQILLCHHRSPNGSCKPLCLLCSILRKPTKNCPGASPLGRSAPGLATGRARMVPQPPDLLHAPRKHTCGVTVVQRAAKRSLLNLFSPRCVASDKRNPSAGWDLQLKTQPPPLTFGINNTPTLSYRRHTEGSLLFHPGSC